MTAPWVVSQLRGNEGLPDFPVEVLPEWLRAEVEALAEALQVPSALPGMVALSVLATACGGRVTVTPNGSWVEPTNLFTAVALPPGSGKTPVFKALRKPLQTIEVEMRESSQARIAQAQSRADIAAKRADAARDRAVKAAPEDVENADAEAAQLRVVADEMVVPPVPRLLAEDATPEALASILIQQGRLAVLSDEGGIFEQMQGRYTGVANLDVYLKGHSGSWLTIDRQGRSKHADEVHLTVGLAVQPDVLAALGESKAMRGRGLVARFLVAWPGSLVGQRNLADAQPVPASVSAAYESKMEAIVRQFADAAFEGTDRAALVLGADAVVMFKEFQRKVESELAFGKALADLADWGNKLPGQVLRLAGLLHVAGAAEGQLTSAISAETLGKAITLAESLVPHMLAVVNLMGETPEAAGGRAILKWVERKGITEFSTADAYRALKAHFACSDDVGAALKLLEERMWVVAVVDGPRTGPQGGRPKSPRWRVHNKSVPAPVALALVDDDEGGFDEEPPAEYWDDEVA